MAGMDAASQCHAISIQFHVVTAKAVLPVLVYSV